MKKSKNNPITDIRNCFSLEENELEIIRILGLFGPLNPNQIKIHSTLTRRKVVYSIDNKLMMNDFIKIHSKKAYRNIRTAFNKIDEKSSSHGHKGGKKIIETKYTLTQKGWLASINLKPLEENYYLNYHIERCPENKKQLLRDHVKSSLEQLALNLNLFNIKLDSVEHLEWILQEMLSWDYALMSDKHEALVTQLRNNREEIAERIKFTDNLMQENFTPLIDKIMQLNDLSSLEKVPLTQKQLIHYVETNESKYRSKAELEKEYQQRPRYGMKDCVVDVSDIFNP